jgi:hypothetical protein
MIRSLLRIVFFRSDWQCTGLLFSFFFPVWRTIRDIHLDRRGKSSIWAIACPPILEGFYQLADIGGYVLSLSITMKVNQRSRLLYFSARLAAHSIMVMVINLVVLMVGECASY